MNGELTASGLPAWAAEALGVSRSSEEQFMDVIGAYARHHQRPKPPTPEQVARIKRLAKKNNPLHVKALAKRRKRKRGGPK